MINQIQAGAISPEEIFMTQMKVVYFLMQASMAGSLLCFIFRLVIFGVLTLQIFFFFLYYANTLRVEYCKRHSIMRTTLEMVIWRVSLVIIQLLTVFVLFNLVYTIVSIFLGNANQDNVYFQSLTNTFSNKKMEITLTVQILCIAIQCVITYIFFFKKNVELTLLKPDAFLDKLIIKDLSLIPDDRNECIICLEDMKPCPNSNRQQSQQDQNKLKQQCTVQEQIKNNLNIECFTLKHHTRSDSPILFTLQYNSKVLGELNQNENLMKIDSIKDDDNQVCPHKITQQTEGDYNVKLDEEQQRIPAINLTALQRITNCNRYKRSERIKSLIVLNDDNYFEKVKFEQPIQSCKDLQNNECNQFQYCLKSRKSSQKSTQIEGEKSTRCDSQYKQDSQFEQTYQQIENISSQYKEDDEQQRKDEYQKNHLQDHCESNTIVQCGEENQQNSSLGSGNEKQYKNTSNFESSEVPQVLFINSRQQSDIENNLPESQSQQQQPEHPIYFEKDKHANKEQLKPQQPNLSKQIVGFKCKHYFHIDCMKQWLKTSQNLRCPTCRQNILA